MKEKTQGAFNVGVDADVSRCPLCNSRAEIIHGLLGANWIQCSRCRIATEMWGNIEDATKEWNSLKERVIIG